MFCTFDIALYSANMASVVMMIVTMIQIQHSPELQRLNPHLLVAKTTMGMGMAIRHLHPESQQVVIARTPTMTEIQA